MTSKASMELIDIPLDAIKVGAERARDIEPAWAATLAGLVQEQGLLQPIIVREVDSVSRDYRLVSGLQRVEAFRILGRDTIPAFLSRAASDDAAQLEELMENLGRYELTALDRCHHLYELKQIHDRKYPDAQKGGRPRGPLLAIATSTAAAAAAAAAVSGKTFPTYDQAPEMFGLATSVAEKVGLSKRAINFAVKIWADLVPAIRRRLHGTPLADKQTELKALSELPPSQQVKVLDLILGESHPDIQNVAAALIHLGATPARAEDERFYKSLCANLSKLTETAFDRLVQENEDRVIASLKRRGRI